MKKKIGKYRKSKQSCAIEILIQAAYNTFFIVFIFFSRVKFEDSDEEMDMEWVSFRM